VHAETFTPVTKLVSSHSLRPILRISQPHITFMFRYVYFTAIRPHMWTVRKYLPHRKSKKYAVVQFFCRTALQAGRSRVRFPMLSLQFFFDITLPAALWPWNRLSL